MSKLIALDLAVIARDRLVIGARLDQRNLQ